MFNIFKVAKAPDFICIGAQKAGTSWLHWNLLFHPDTEMPPEKEINFFYPPGLPFPREFHDTQGNPEEWANQQNQLNSQTWIKWYHNLQRAIKSKDRNYEIKWWKQSLFSDRTAENYIKLFKRSKGKISGDMSPAYANMSESDIAKLVEAAPKAKIIYLLRHPIERSWSSFRMVNREFLLNKPSEEAILNFITNDPAAYKYTRSSLYSEKLQRWERYCSDRMKVWFYDHLCENPEEFFGEICQYLNIRPIFTFNHNKIYEKVHDSHSYSIPKSVHQYFLNILKEEIILLHRRFNNSYTQRWVDSLRAK